MEKKYAEYQGKKVSLNKPFRTPKRPKKFAVYVRNKKGNVVKVSFGDPKLEIKRDNPERRKSFRARHKCDEKNDPTTPGYWSCRFWESNKSVSELLSKESEVTAGSLDPEGVTTDIGFVGKKRKKKRILKKGAMLQESKQEEVNKMLEKKLKKETSKFSEEEATSKSRRL